MNDTRIPLLFATIGYWLVGFTSAWALGFQTSLGAVGVWIGLSIGTVVFAVLADLALPPAGEQTGAAMTVHEITPAIDPNTLLPGAQFADAYRIEVDDRALNARQAAERMIARQPRWADALVTLRNLAGGAVWPQDIGRQPRPRPEK